MRIVHVVLWARIGGGGKGGQCKLTPFLLYYCTASAQRCCLPCPAPCPAESPTKSGSRRRRPGQPPAAAHRALMVVFQRGRQVWSQGASLASLGEEVGQGI